MVCLLGENHVRDEIIRDSKHVAWFPLALAETDRASFAQTRTYMCEARAVLVPRSAMWTAKRNRAYRLS